MTTDIWSAVDALMPRAVERPPNSFTIREYAERYGLSCRTALTQVEQLVRGGRLESTISRVGHRPAKVYWIPEVKPCPSSTRSVIGRTGKATARRNG